MSDTVILVLGIISTIAFAISGVMVAMKKGMDVFGIVILGLITAVGGGVIRDLVIGNTPPVVFTDPMYAIVAISVSILLCFPVFRKMANKNHKFFNLILLISDTIGLALFSVLGVKITADAHVLASDGKNYFLLLFVGVISGVGGGVMRDMMAGEQPAILVRRFYACASIAGTLVCIILWDIIGEALAMVLGFIVICVLRFLAAKFRWSLPKIKRDEIIEDDD